MLSYGFLDNNHWVVQIISHVKLCEVRYMSVTTSAFEQRNGYGRNMAQPTALPLPHSMSLLDYESVPLE